MKVPWGIGHGEGSELRFSRSLAVFHIGGIVVLILVVLSSVLGISQRHNELARDSAERMVRGGLAAFQGKMRTVVRDYSIWDEAYAAIGAGDVDWLYSNIGTGAAEIGAIDIIVLVEPGRGERGWRRGSPVEGEADLVPPDLLAAITGLVDAADHDTPVTRSAFALMHGEPWAFAVTRVRPMAGVPAGVPDAAMPRQVHGLRITPEVLQGIGANILMDDLVFAAEPQPGEGALALESIGGAPIGHVVWTPPRPGASILRQAALPLGLALLAVALIGTLSSRYAVRSAERLERALIDAKAADRSKTEFLSNVSHELRTPMNGIIGVAQLLQMTNLDDEQKELVAVLSASADAQMALISDLLDISRMEGGNRPLVNDRFEPAAVLHEIAELVRPTTAQKNIRLECDIGELDGLSVWGDCRAFRQIVTNLLGNAAKFTQEGRVLLAARIARSARTAELVVRVQDTGRGIAPEHQARIFERFYQVDGSQTRDASGTGLGLAISHTLAVMMGGRIELESEPGAGSTFTFRVNLPLAELRQGLQSAA